MQLHSFFNSSTSYRTRIALALKGLSYDCLPVNLRAGDQRLSDYLNLNPSGGVPVLTTDDDLLITQSLAIIDYVDNRYGGIQLIPQASEERARVLEIAYLISCDIHPLNNLRVLAYLEKNLGVNPEQKSQWYRHWIEQGMQALETLLSRYGHGPYCLGDEPTLADCCLVPQVANALRMGCDVERFELTLAIYRHCLKHPAFQAAAPKNQPDYVK
ncbi:maleylacetoacetate isomerase [Pseudomonas sp. 32A]|uniref:maleylacetoacetate isomerase n=1 Tax=Pseudomonas sp. 32A TaxID=651185 RepID=UPI0040451DA9